MYPVPLKETLVETKTCKHCGASFPITDADLEFYEKISPVFAGKKYAIPAPTLCPDCRLRRRHAFINLRKLYRRKCDVTGKEIVSIYHSEKPFPVYSREYWNSDKWDPLSFGVPYDPSKGFFYQLEKLFQKVPRIQSINIASENSDYVSIGGWNKNCYFISGSCSEDCLYGSLTFKSTDCVDYFFSISNEHSYETIRSSNCYKVFFTKDCRECSDSYFLRDCTGCRHCFGCVNLTNQEYQIYNTPVSKEDFENHVRKTFNGQYSVLKEALLEFQKFSDRMPERNLFMSGCENCIGDNVSWAKDVAYCFDSARSEGAIENSKFADLVTSLGDSYDITDTGKVTRSYENVSSLNGHGLFGNFLIIDSSSVFFSNDCTNCEHVFGCSGLRNKRYCLLNRQYEKHEYESIVSGIVAKMIAEGEWGEYLPVNISPFGYNETSAAERFPMERPEALSIGFNWSDYEPPFPKVEKTIPASKLPENIADVPDDILNWAIECEVTKRPFRIVRQELEFYRKHHLPIPRRHPDQRHLDRIFLQNPRRFFEQNCGQCGQKMITTSPPERKRKIYCETCYQEYFPSEVFG